MTALWLTLIGLLLSAVFMLFLPLVIGRKKNSAVISQQQQNIAIFQDRLNELEQEKAQNNLSEAAFLELKIELEKSLLADVEGNTVNSFAPVTIAAKHWAIIAVLAFFMVLISLAMYVQLGRSEDYGKYLTLQAQAAAEAKAVQEKHAKVLEIIALLKAKLKQNPDDLEKWFLLANTYSVIGEYSQAAATYLSASQTIEKNNPNYAVIKGSYAQMLFQAAGEKVTPAVQQAIKEALAIDPLESSALILSGIDAYNQGDMKQAVVYWEKAKVKAQADVLANFIEPVIQQTKAQLGQTTTQAVTVGTAKITVNLDLDPALKAKVKPGQRVFVFARPVGGKMPLAAQKLQVQDLPITIVLDDSKAVMPTAVLSSAVEVELTARVSLTGQPQPSKGDFFATIEKVKVNNDGKTVQMLINQVVQ
jgi:cytochrome c-type biogenesis protein CcmH